jgi:NADPH:quinone reductase-like Zn-dependent oxidoreductase
MTSAVVLTRESYLSAPRLCAFWTGDTWWASASSTQVLVHGAAGNVGAYAVQLARRVAKEVVATSFPADLEYVRTLGAHQVIDVTACRFEEAVTSVDIVLDTVGGETLDRSFAVLAPGGVLVSSVETPDPVKASQHHVRGVFFLVHVSSPTLARLADLVVAGELVTAVGTVLPLTEARLAHEMLAGKPHNRGKLVLTMTT